MVNRNEHNLPTYFQIGRNSLDAAESLYTSDPANKGLLIIPRGKRQNIPIGANILAKSDSAERLNLKNARKATDSPSRKFAAKLRIEERKFREQFEGERLPGPGNEEFQQKMGNLLTQKQLEEDIRLKIIVEKLKNKGNKKCHFKLMRNVDNERLLK